MYSPLPIGLVALAFIDGIGGPEVLMVMFIALVLFGGKSLPSFARTVGKSLREFKKATGEVEKEIRRAIDEAPEQPARPASVPPSTEVKAVPASSTSALPPSAPAVPQSVPVPEYSPYPELASLEPSQAELPQPQPSESATSPLPPAPTAGENKT